MGGSILMSCRGADMMIGFLPDTLTVLLGPPKRWMGATVTEFMPNIASRQAFNRSENSSKVIIPSGERERML
jgi:hypothetical protein